MTEPESSARSYSFRGRVVRAGESPASSGNLANIITVVRILLAPLFVVLLVLDGGADGPLRVAAAVLFMGLYPLPFTEVMHASVNELLRHVALPKI